MFEIGRYYRIKTGYADEIGESLYLIREFIAPLLKVESVEGETILNTHAPTFHAAVLDPRPVTDNIFMDKYMPGQPPAQD